MGQDSMLAAPRDRAGPGGRIGTFDNSYARLPEIFFARQPPVPVENPTLTLFNRALAEELGLNVPAIEALGPAALFSGRLVPEGAEPLAAAYAGHQFGGFSPKLGDGRAILLGEVIDRAGQRRDLQLKGAGRTPFSRGGDGRAALGPVLREYLVSESMHALGIPTTRALAAVTTGEVVYRDRALPGAVLTRVAASHIRVGSFQYFAARRDEDAVRRLADHVIGRHYPAARDAANPYLALLDAVIGRQAALIARWMQVGFIHGVMNTDNMAVSGETIDYGPCAFMDAMDPATVFSSIDTGGRYAYANQPRIAQWNLARFAETLLPLLDPSPDRAVALASEAINGFSARFEVLSLDGMRAKLGLLTAQAEDRGLIGALLALMHKNAADFTVTFRRLANLAETDDATAGPRTLFADPAAFDAWAATWQQRLAREPHDPAARAAAMRQVNPAFIPRNYLVEQALAAAVEAGDLQPFERLLHVLARPYEDQPDAAALAAPAPVAEEPYLTFCGT
jgi:uncharacterized protein YdiU (UPF0061 family)